MNRRNFIKGLTATAVLAPLSISAADKYSYIPRFGFIDCYITPKQFPGWYPGQWSILDLSTRQHIVNHNTWITKCDDKNGFYDYFTDLKTKNLTRVYNRNIALVYFPDTRFQKFDPQWEKHHIDNILGLLDKYET